MATIAELDIVLGLKGQRRVEQGLSRVERSTRGAERAGRDLQSLYRGAMATGAVFVAKEMFELGTAVEETASKFNTVFGDSSRELHGFIEQFGTLAGMSRQQAQAVLATTGSIAQGLGFAEQASAEFAREIVQLSGDLSSFNNIPMERTSRAIQAAVTGEREQLKALGIVLRETDVQQRALAISGKASADALTTQEKATATLQLITERAGVAVGDLARTQDSTANRARALAAELQNIRETIATALLPVMAVGVEGFNAFIGGIQIMGAEAAVLVARFNFWKEAAIGTEESTMRANDVLREMRIAAEQTKLEVVGLTFNLDGLQNTLSSSGGGGASGAMREFEIAERTVTTTSQFLGDVVITLATDLQLLGVATGYAADETERLNTAQSKISAVTGALGFVSRLPGLGFISEPLGLLSGGLSSFFGLDNAFGGGRASGGPVNAGMAYMVGEAGPEMFLPNQSGTIVPNGGVTINVPPARDPITMARDAQWQRAILATFEALEGNGFRATA